MSLSDALGAAYSFLALLGLLDIVKAFLVVGLALYFLTQVRNLRN